MASNPKVGPSSSQQTQPTQRTTQQPKEQEDRDPNHINEHLRIRYPDVLGEPDGIHSCDIIWECSFILFSCFKNLCYGLVTLLCGFWLAAYWGVCFGCIGFQHIWIFTPFLKLFGLFLDMFRCCRPVIRCCIIPCVGSCGHLFILFAKPGADPYAWAKVEVKTPVQRMKPPPKKDEKKEDDKKSVKVIPPPNPENLYLGKKADMAKSIQRQMGLV